MSNLLGRLLLVFACLLSFPTSSHAGLLSELIEKVIALATKKAPHKIPIEPHAPSHPSPPTGPLQDGGSTAGSQFPTGPIVSGVSRRLTDRKTKNVASTCTGLSQIQSGDLIIVESDNPIILYQSSDRSAPIARSLSLGAHPMIAVRIVELKNQECLIEVISPWDASKAVFMDPKNVSVSLLLEEQPINQGSAE